MTLGFFPSPKYEPKYKFPIGRQVTDAEGFCREVMARQHDIYNGRDFYLLAPLNAVTNFRGREWVLGDAIK